ncbi:MAG: hypothetical protein Q9161_009812 [Pseudevernia consocians]
MQRAKISTGMQTRAMARQALADITPAAEPGTIDTTPDTASANEFEPNESPQSWDSLCVSEDCPIKHPHNFGLRPQTSSATLVVWQDDDAVIDDDRGYPDTQPPPLIKAMIDTLRVDPMIKMRYPRFTDVLRDFYLAHGGRSDIYHGPAGMFGLGVDHSGGQGYEFYPLHKHPSEDGVGIFAFEME